MPKDENDEVSEIRERARNKARHSGNILRAFFGSVFDHPNPTQEAVQQAGVTSRAMEVTAEWANRGRARAAYFMGLLKALEETATYGRDRFADIQEEALTDLMGPDFVADDEGEVTVTHRESETTMKVAETDPVKPKKAETKEDLT